MVTHGMNNFLFLVDVFLLIQCCGSANYCQEAVDSVKTVESCPTSKAEWDNAARMKNCDEKALKQNCSAVDRFVYHCVINGYRNVTLEVCAPTRIIFGHCVEFNVAGGVIQDQFSAACNETFPKCDAFYLSSTAYKYSDCYNLVLKRDINVYQSTTTKDASIGTIDLLKTEVAYLTIGLLTILTFIVIVIVAAVIISKRGRQRQTEISNKKEETIKLLHREKDIDNAIQGMPIGRTPDTCIRRSSTCITTCILSETATPTLRRSFSVNYTKHIKKSAHELFLRIINHKLTTGKQKESTNKSEENERLLPPKNDIEQDTFKWTRQPSLKPIFYFDANEESIVIP